MKREGTDRGEAMDTGTEPNCREAQPMVGAYLDGELEEARAAGLRKHLLGCVACRGGLQDGKTLRRWFAPLREAGDERGGEFAAAVPAGFAARVARRAFAGDVGERPTFGEPRTLGEQRPPAAGEGRLLRFVVRLTAVAAAAAIVVAVTYRAQSRPSGDQLSADDRGAHLSVQEIQHRLDRLNQGLEVREDDVRQGATGADPRGRERDADPTKSDPARD
jgi:hypothetical protein